MGLLVDGKWADRWYPTHESAGHFEREQSCFRDWVRADGSTDFSAAAGRYHLYVSLACPWAHRTLIARKLKKLEEVIGVTVVDPLMLEKGWVFSDRPGCGSDPINGASCLYELYQLSRADYTGRVTVPLLWDRELGCIVNNESSEILRMFNREFDAFGDAQLDLYPEALRSAIDAINELVYSRVNNGVYRCGFASTQAAYDEALDVLFDTLDELEARLAQNRFLVGDTITEADWRLFVTLVRFDHVYVGHFKCSRRRIVDYPQLWAYTRELFQIPGVADTVSFDHIKEHYYGSHGHINPTGIVPGSPRIDFWQPPSRA